ncbi:hypothetical protein VN97_g9939 [Penicillium thymicola]|uniref:Uncharacterized protein n=1 Tax=Penicillium thymicola TaxID=293382 RepID=A0AAI9X4E6_PENTH|nr:hypothetical protein VN97_g9939 [Penicillium thymicola]
MMIHDFSFCIQSKLNNFGPYQLLHTYIHTYIHTVGFLSLCNLTSTTLNSINISHCTMHFDVNVDLS